MKHWLHLPQQSGSGQVFRCRRQKVECLGVLQTHLENLIECSFPRPGKLPVGAVRKHF